MSIQYHSTSARVIDHDHPSLAPVVPKVRLDDIRTKCMSFEKPCLHPPFLVLAIVETGLGDGNQYDLETRCQNSPRLCPWRVPEALREWNSTWMGLTVKIRRWLAEAKRCCVSLKVVGFSLCTVDCCPSSDYSPFFCNNLMPCPSIWCKSISRWCAGLSPLPLSVGTITVEMTSSSFGAVNLLLVIILLALWLNTTYCFAWS